MNCKKKYFVLFLAIVMSISVLNTDVFAKSKSEGWKLNNKGKSQAKNMQHEEAVKTFEQLKDVWKSFDWNADPDMEQEYMIADRNAEQLRTYSDVYVERNASGNTKNFTNAKLEPKVGCYLGALAPHEQTLYGATYFREFPALVGKDLAGYLIYMNYGDNIETFRTHFQEAKNNDCSIELALEPNSGLDMVQDDETLRTFARKLNEFDAPVFLRFANEMNDTGNAWHLEGPEKYKEKFKIVANVIHEEAPKVAMVWAPNNFPFTKIDMYYPGDEYVDWVGLSIYAVNQPEVDPMDQGIDRRNYSSEFEHVYKTYSDRKPIMLSEGAASYNDGTDLTKDVVDIDMDTTASSTYDVDVKVKGHNGDKLVVEVRKDGIIDAGLTTAALNINADPFTTATASDTIKLPITSRAKYEVTAKVYEGSKVVEEQVLTVNVKDINANNVVTYKTLAAQAANVTLTKGTTPNYSVIKVPFDVKLADLKAEDFKTVDKAGKTVNVELRENNTLLHVTVTPEKGNAVTYVLSVVNAEVKVDAGFTVAKLADGADTVKVTVLDELGEEVKGLSEADFTEIKDGSTALTISEFSVAGNVYTIKLSAAVTTATNLTLKVDGVSVTAAN